MAEPSFRGHRRHGRRAGWIERMTGELFATLEYALYAETTTARRGLLQRLDPRVKLVGLPALAIAAVAARPLWLVYALLAASVALAVVSRIALRASMARLWLSVLVFTGALALPALFLVDGDVLWQLPGPSVHITRQGLASAAFLVGRGLTAASFAMLLILTTPWPHVLKALRALHVPAVAVALLGMTFRHVFALLESATRMFEARRSRTLARVGRRGARRAAAASLAVLLARSIERGNEVHLAMLARGYRGRDASLHEFAMAPRDWLALAGFAAATALAFWLGATGHG